MSQLFCPVRKLWVAAQPEELVRQQLITKMIDQLGYPLSHISLEKELSHMPHLQLQDRPIPQRRADILCFAKDIHPQHALYPLLMIECKAIKLNSKVLQQVAGYNHFIGAYFIAIANADEIKTGWYSSTKKSYEFISYLPTYPVLLQTIAKNTTSKI